MRCPTVGGCIRKPSNKIGRNTINNSSNISKSTMEHNEITNKIELELINDVDMLNKQDWQTQAGGLCYVGSKWHVKGKQQLPFIL